MADDATTKKPDTLSGALDYEVYLDDMLRFCQRLQKAYQGEEPKVAFPAMSIEDTKHLSYLNQLAVPSALRQLHGNAYDQMRSDWRIMQLANATREDFYQSAQDSLVRKIALIEEQQKHYLACARSIDSMLPALAQRSPAEAKFVDDLQKMFAKAMADKPEFEAKMRAEMGVPEDAEVTMDVVRQYIKLRQDAVADRGFPIPMIGKGYEAFREALGRRESSGNYRAKNSYGFLGKYQFGKARLSDFGLARLVVGTKNTFDWVPPYSEEAFLNSPNLQDQIFDLHIVSLRAQVLRLYGNEISAGTIHGYTVTLSGAIAASHLLGPGIGTSKNPGFGYFVRNGVSGQDAYGTSALSYVQLFNGYEVIESVPSKNLSNLLS